MKTDADLKERIADLESELEFTRSEIKSLELELSDKEDELEASRDEVSELSDELESMSNRSILTFVANALYRRDVLGLDDGDVLSIIHEKLQTSY